MWINILFQLIFSAFIVPCIAHNWHSFSHASTLWDIGWDLKSGCRHDRNVANMLSALYPSWKVGMFTEQWNLIRRVGEIKWKVKTYRNEVVPRPRLIFNSDWSRAFLLLLRCHASISVVSEQNLNLFYIQNDSYEEEFVLPEYFDVAANDNFIFLSIGKSQVDHLEEEGVKDFSRPWWSSYVFTGTTLSSLLVASTLSMLIPGFTSLSAKNE